MALNESLLAPCWISLPVDSSFLINFSYPRFQVQEMGMHTFGKFLPYQMFEVAHLKEILTRLQ